MSGQQTGTLFPNTPDRIGNVNVRSTQSVASESNIVARIKSGTRVIVLPDTPIKDASGFTWYKVIYDQQANKVGWVRDDVIELDPKTSNPTPPGTPQAKFKLIVTAKTTWFKQSHLDSTLLQDDAKQSFPKNTVLLISTYQENPAQDPSDKHFFVTLASPLQIGKFNSWFVFKDDISITLNQ